MSKLANFPIMFFAVVMGLGGLGIAYGRFSELMGFGELGFIILRGFILAVFVLILALYLAKTIKYFSKVKEEFSHPIKVNFFATIPISLLILANLFQSGNALIYGVCFYLGVVLQTYFSFHVIAFWINNNLEIKHSNPAWFIPIVGNLIVVIAAKSVDFWLWYYFAIGMFFGWFYLA
ncbi:hypothetical protein [Helicobacter sp. 16-1353]|uniref:SLAC1 family transporter n=1 Tax=Helicobacter sp. 16-1353 TaxID=2004996 RepID=UPI00215C3D59|nr:hypothetical protein [Helicobacter sp. 16-1353]